MMLGASNNMRHRRRENIYVEKMAFTIESVGDVYYHPGQGA